MDFFVLFCFGYENSVNDKSKQTKTHHTYIVIYTFCTYPIALKNIRNSSCVVFSTIRSFITVQQSVHFLNDQ